MNEMCQKYPGHIELVEVVRHFGYDLKHDQRVEEDGEEPDRVLTRGAIVPRGDMRSVRFDLTNSLPDVGEGRGRLKGWTLRKNVHFSSILKRRETVRIFVHSAACPKAASVKPR